MYVYVSGYFARVCVYACVPGMYMLVRMFMYVFTCIYIFRYEVVHFAECTCKNDITLSFPCGHSKWHERQVLTTSLVRVYSET